MSVLGKGIKNLSNFKSFDLSNNRITEKSVTKLLDNIKGRTKNFFSIFHFLPNPLQNILIILYIFNL